MTTATPLTILEKLLDVEKLKAVSRYMKDASQSRLTRSMTGFGSLKHLAYSLRRIKDAEKYQVLLQDLYLVAITHHDQLDNLIGAIEEKGSTRLARFVAKIEPDADTTGMIIMQLKKGKVAFNIGTKNLASIALAKADIYVANSSKGACIMTRRIWKFNNSFKPVGFKRVHKNLFMSDTPMRVDTSLMEKALSALEKR